MNRNKTFSGAIKPAWSKAMRVAAFRSDLCQPGCSKIDCNSGSFAFNAVKVGVLFGKHSQIIRFTESYEITFIVQDLAYDNPFLSSLC